MPINKKGGIKMSEQQGIQRFFGGCGCGFGGGGLIILLIIGAKKWCRYL